MSMSDAGWLATSADTDAGPWLAGGCHVAGAGAVIGRGGAM